MSFIFSRALVEAFSPASFEDTDASAPSNRSPTLKPFLWHDRTMAPSRLSRFGVTCALLTDDRGATLLTSLLEAFRARTSAQPAPAKGSMESEAAYGPKWLGSFARYSPAESKWKTAQCSLLGDSDEFSETWPRWGSMRNGECYLRPILAPHILESGSGFAERFPTPIRNDAEKRGNFDPVRSYGLAGHVKLFPTPCAIDAGSGRVNKSLSTGAAERPTLALMARKGMWPTPCASASASKGSSPAALTRKTGKSRANDRIDHAVMASDGGQLNPEWVEWLMGWPIGHTALEPLETAKYREWLRQHSPCSPAEWIGETPIAREK
jgi:hypothetical protein